MTPIDKMLETVKWEIVDSGPKLVGDGELPHVTHSGILDLFGKSLRCYRLSDGQAVFDCDDVADFFEV